MKKGTNVKARDLRPWFVNDATWTPGYVAPPNDAVPANVTREGLGRLLDSAAASGDSAFLDVCFDVDNKR